MRLRRRETELKVFKVTKPGMFTTVQDMGRYGYLKYGVPVSGAMDTFSLIAANSLVENDPNAACLEITLIGPQLEAVSNTQIAVTGGDCSLEIDGEAISMWQTVAIRQGETLSFNRMQSGCRSYISVRGGVDVPEVLGSKSTYVRGGFGGLSGRQLKEGDIVEAVSSTVLSVINSFPEELIPNFSNNKTIRVVMGPQAEMFTDQGIRNFLSSPYTVGLDSDRMGYRLEGSTIEHVDKADIVSDALLPGAIQVPRNGKPIVIMRDAQTTGGYPKIAVVITPDVDLFGQTKSNDEVKFSKITLHDAMQHVIEYCKKISSLKTMMVRA